MTRPASQRAPLNVRQDDWLHGSRRSNLAPLDSLQEEFERYRMMRRDKAHTWTPEEWWRRHQAKYPLVSILAGEYLCIPASSSGIERTFSINGYHLSKRRQAMKSQKVHELTFVRDNLHLLPDDPEDECDTDDTLQNLEVD